LRHTVVWLNEIQEVLEQDRGVEQLDRLLDRTIGPTVLLATLRADAEDTLPGTAARRLLGRAAPRITLHRRPPPAEFDRELARARALDDPWLVEVFPKIGDRYGFAESLAAGPQLIDELERARASDNPVKQTAAALVDGAIDCYRAGFTQPIPEALLLAAYQLYRPEHLRHATHPTTADALAWARTPVAGASALLEWHGWGDRAFDYLLAPASDTPEGVRHQGIWRLLLAHVTPATARSVISAAYRVGQLRIGRVLIGRHPADQRAQLFADAGDNEALAALANSGDVRASSLVVHSLAARGDIDALSARADAGDEHAASELIRLLAARGEINALTARGAAGNRRAAWELAERGDMRPLTALADAGDQYAADWLARLLEDRDIDTLVTRAEAGDQHAGQQFARLLASPDLSPLVGR
jgi:hypothetical protein